MALGVGNGDDLDIVWAFAENHGERIAVEDYAAGAVKIWWTHQRVISQSSISFAKFRVEAKSGI